MPVALHLFSILRGKWLLQNKSRVLILYMVAVRRPWQQGFLMAFFKPGGRFSRSQTKGAVLVAEQTKGTVPLVVQIKNK